MYFPVRVPLEVRFSDLDTLKHVNNAVYLTYDEVARGHYLRRAGATIDSGHFVMARAEVDYIQPILFEQQVEIALRVERVGNSSFRTHSEIWANGALAARIKVVVVWLEDGKPARIPDWLREAIRTLETEPVEGL
ncbi:thioesterase family protein [Meiothermus sp. CFH 77666]|uniref:acyl-CoA thioesterase n=1 Tax=Meiothermus sp. CFH 77666 TaxID=2817942 RepID=UPI001AA068FE|nr:thioesterase family protein [Meiothermus sp. CFH 77666]MBO1436921.1 acyl-CoA thioesterase [Meiothermus sp. CFH 77666]